MAILTEYDLGFFPSQIAMICRLRHIPFCRKEILHSFTGFGSHGFGGGGPVYVSIDSREKRTRSDSSGIRVVNLLILPLPLRRTDIKNPWVRT